MALRPEHRPTLAQKLAAAANPGNAVRYLKAQQRFRRAGKPIRSQAGQQEAWQHCLACPHFHPRTQRCRQSGCGCFLGNKIPMATEACPIGRWHAERDPEGIADAISVCLECPWRKGWHCTRADQGIGELAARRDTKCPEGRW